jgi:hypothetical protein
LISKEAELKAKISICTFAATLSTIGWAQAQAASGDGVPVTPDNFVRAESDLYLEAIVKDAGFGKFFHNREPTPIDKQNVSNHR